MVSVDGNRIITKTMTTTIKELFDNYPIEKQEEIDWGDESQGEEIW